MEYIDYNKISDLVAKGDINYIAYVTTPWHLIGAKAAILYIKQKGIEVKPIIIASPHPETGFAVTTDDELSFYQLDNVVPKTQLFKYISFLLWCWRDSNNREPNFYIANPWYGKFKRIFWILSKFRAAFNIIIFEEGIGTYVKEYYSLKSPMNKRNLLQSIQLGVDLCLSRHCYNTGRLINLNPLCYNNNGTLSYNEYAITLYKKALNIESLVLDENKVVLLTQETDEEIYRVVNSVSQYLSSVGVEVYIKAHPRFPIDEKQISCRVNMVEHAIAIESVLQNIKAKYVISFNTTALLSLRYLYDVSTISLIHCVKEDCCQGLFNPHGRFNTWFENTFSGIIQFPKNINDLQGLLGSSTKTNV